MKRLKYYATFSIIVLLALTVAPLQAATTPNQDQIEQTSRQFFATLNVGDIDAWLDLLAKNVVAFEPVGTPAIRGKDALREWATGPRQAFKSVTIEVQDIFVAGNSAAIRWSTTFVLPDDTTLVIDGIDVHTYNKRGKIKKVEAYFDPSPLFALMGN